MLLLLSPLLLVTTTTTATSTCYHSYPSAAGSCHGWAGWASYRACYHRKGRQDNKPLPNNEARWDFENVGVLRSI